MNFALLRRVTLVAMGILLLVLVQTSDVSRVVAIAVLALAAYDIVTGLRGPRRTPEQRHFEAVERQAEELGRSDPAAADRLLDGYFEEAGKRAAQERAALRTEAAVDLGAAKRLATLLQQEMDGHRVMRERFLSRVEPEERATAEAKIDEREHQTQVELDNLEVAIRRLKA